MHRTFASCLRWIRREWIWLRVSITTIQPTAMRLPNPGWSLKSQIGKPQVRVPLVFASSTIVHKRKNNSPQNNVLRKKRGNSIILKTRKSCGKFDYFTMVWRIVFFDTEQKCLFGRILLCLWRINEFPDYFWYFVKYDRICVAHTVHIFYSCSVDTIDTLLMFCAYYRHTVHTVYTYSTYSTLGLHTVHMF